MGNLQIDHIRVEVNLLFLRFEFIMSGNKLAVETAVPFGDKIRDMTSELDDRREDRAVDHLEKRKIS